jgi:hypothetical protein
LRRPVCAAHTAIAMVSDEPISTAGVDRAEHHVELVAGLGEALVVGAR